MPTKQELLDDLIARPEIITLQDNGLKSSTTAIDGKTINQYNCTVWIKEADGDTVSQRAYYTVFNQGLADESAGWQREPGEAVYAGYEGKVEEYLSTLDYATAQLLAADTKRKNAFVRLWTDGPAGLTPQDICIYPDKQGALTHKKLNGSYINPFAGI